MFKIFLNIDNLNNEVYTHSINGTFSKKLVTYLFTIYLITLMIYIVKFKK